LFGLVDDAHPTLTDLTNDLVARVTRENIRPSGGPQGRRVPIGRKVVKELTASRAVIQVLFDLGNTRRIEFSSMKGAKLVVGGVNKNARGHCNSSHGRYSASKDLG
jgi:hypothetical protein